MVQDPLINDKFISFEDQPKATIEKTNSRISVCMECPHYSDDHCDKCGCTISIITQVDSAICPLKKW